MPLSLHQEPRTGPFPLLHDGLCVFLSFTKADQVTVGREQISGSRPTTYLGTPIKDKWGRPCLHFNGSSDYLVYSDGAPWRPPSTAVTMYMRAKLNSIPAGGAGAGKIHTASGLYSYGWEISTAHIDAYVQPTTVVSTATAPPTGTWTHTIMRWVSGGPVTCECYYDGGAVAVAKATGSNASGTIAYDTGQFYMGSTQSLAAFVGMDASTFAVWNRRLTDAEMRLIVSDPAVLDRRTNLSLSQLLATPSDVEAQPFRPLLRPGGHSA